MTDARDYVAGLALNDGGGGAFAILERREAQDEDDTAYWYEAVYLRALGRQVSYQRMADIVAGHLSRGESPFLCVDISFVGRAIVNLFGAGVRLCEWNEDERSAKDLVAALRVLVDENQLRFARGLKALPAFLPELRAFSAIRFGLATPLAKAVALAVWAGEEHRVPEPRLWGGGGGGWGPGSWGRLGGPRKPGWMP